MKTIYERLDAILPRVTDPDFRKNKGRGNEINFHVFDYMPKDELLVRDRIQLIKNKAQSIHFDDIYSEKKFKYSREYHFAFNQLTDDRPKGSQTNEIGIRVITPNYDLVGGASDSELRLQSSRENNMIVNISKDGGYIDEVQYKGKSACGSFG